MFEQISIDDIIEKQKAIGGIIVDLRSKQEYERGHIVGANNMPFEQIDAFHLEWNKDRPILLYCKYGTRSIRMAKILYDQGYHVINTVGGYEQYTGKIERK